MAKNSNSKRPLKKVQKKYALAGFNSGSVAMSRQNPYYIGQVEEENAKQQFANASEEAAYAAQQAKAKKKQEEEMLKQQKKDAAQSSLQKLGNAAVKDQKAGNLGKIMLKDPPVIGNPDPFAFMQAPTQSIGTGTAIEGVGVLAPEYMPAAQAGLGTGVDAGVGVLAPEYIVPAPVASTTASTAASSGGLMTANMSALGSAGIGVGLSAAGMITERTTDDKRASTSTQKERTGNTVGEGLKGAGAGWGYGALAGSIVPGVGNVVGGLVGGVIGAGVGVYKGIKENKAAKGEAKDIQRQDRMTRAAYQSALVNSRLSTLNTGFGLNSSTNMNNDNTTAYGQNMGTQYARTGGAKKVPGGQIVPMGKNAVKFLGRKHEQGGIDLDPYTEVEGDETMQKDMKMKNGKKNDYFFSSFLKVGNKTFAQKHEEILKSGLPKRTITAKLQDLAKLQEQVAGRDPEEVQGGEKAYRLGGQMLFKKGGANDKPTACPEGYVLETSLSGADGTCVPKEWKEKEQGLHNELSKKYGDDWWDDGKNPKSAVAFEEYMKEIATISMNIFGEDYDYPLPATFNASKGSEGEAIAPRKGDREKFAKEGSKSENSKTGSSKEDLANVLDNVGPGGIEEGVYNKDEAIAQTNAANKLAEEEKKKEEKKKEEPAAEDDYMDKLWLDKGYEPDGQGGFRVPAGKKLDANGNIVDDVPAPSGTAPTVDDAELKKWNGSKEAYDAFQDAKNNIMNDPDLKKDLIDQYRKVIEDEGSYTGKKSGTKQAFKTKYYDDLSKLGDDDIIKELLAQEERNARLAAFGFDAAKTSQNAGARGGTTNAEADKFAAEHPELSDLDWSGGHRGQAAYIAYNQLMNTDKYKGYAAEQFGVSDESVGGVVGKVSGIDKFSTNTTLGQRLNYKGKPTPPPPTPPPGTPPPTETPPPSRTPCPPGHYVDEQGNCIKLPEWKPKDEFKLPGLLQLIPVGYAMMNPYQKDKGIPGSPGITGPLMPRVNLNQERASAVSSQVALNTAIQNQNMGPGAISAMIATAGKTNEQMLKIAKQEQDSNKQLAAEEAKLGMQASMFNVENEQKRQFANADLRVAEKKYKREEILGTLDAAVNRITGIAKDDRMFKANERLAKAMDETGSYDRFTLYENLQKEAKNKRSPLYGKNEVDLRNMAAGYSKLFYGDKGIVADQFNGQANTQTQTQQKLGGARQYTSRLGELTKRSKLRIK